MKRIQINTFGCKVNQYESASFHSGFEELGHQIVSSGSNCDIIVINTCSVTGKAGAQARQAIRRAVRHNPQARVVITGCYSQVAGRELQEMQELQGREVCLIGNGDKHLLVETALAEEFAPLSLPEPIDRNNELAPLPIRSFAKRTRAYLRIQDGCNSFCTYCIVPYTRGRSRSLRAEEVLKQASIFADEGYREIVVTGIHVGNYGADLDGHTDISSIMEMLCRTTPHIRYRLSSIEPLEISSALLKVMSENANFMPHLHIPLQSGSDDILLRMNRRYTTSQFAEITANCRRRIDDLAIGIDVLAGFPGETDEHFAATYAFLENLDFTYLHVFPYSKRPGTPAADYPDQVTGAIKEYRVDKLRQLSDMKKETFYRRFLGSSRPLLVENRKDRSGRLKGFTDNYIPVSFTGSEKLHNSVVQVQLDTVNKTSTTGRVIQNSL